MNNILFLSFNEKSEVYTDKDCKDLIKYIQKKSPNLIVCCTQNSLSSSKYHFQHIFTNFLEKYDYNCFLKFDTADRLSMAGKTTSYFKGKLVGLRTRVFIKNNKFGEIDIKQIRLNKNLDIRKYFIKTCLSIKINNEEYILNLINCNIKENNANKYKSTQFRRLRESIENVMSHNNEKIFLACLFEEQYVVSNLFDSNELLNTFQSSMKEYYKFLSSKFQMNRKSENIYSENSSNKIINNNNTSNEYMINNPSNEFKINNLSNKIINNPSNKIINNQLGGENDNFCISKRNKNKLANVLSDPYTPIPNNNKNVGYFTIYQQLLISGINKNILQCLLNGIYTGHSNENLMPMPVFLNNFIEYLKRTGNNSNESKKLILLIEDILSDLYLSFRNTLVVSNYVNPKEYIYKDFYIKNNYLLSLYTYY